jgi:hypothetical protein
MTAHYAQGPGEVTVQMNFSSLQYNAVAEEMKVAYSTKFNAKVGGILDRGGREMMAELHQRINLPEDGPPGVRYITGRYFRSWKKQVLYRFSNHPTLLLYTNENRARRLEYGFTGIDSLGRMVNAPPYPHAGPAFDAVMPRIEAEILLAAGLEFR